MGASFPSSILELEGTAPGKWPRDGLRIVYRLRSQNGFHGAGGGAGRQRREIFCSAWGGTPALLPLGPALFLGSLTGPSPLQSLSRAGVGASVCASPPRPCMPVPHGSPAARCYVATEAVCVVCMCGCVHVSVCSVWCGRGVGFLVHRGL